MGATGTYQINDTDLTVQPTYGKWLPREIIDIDGNGHAVYPPYRQFEVGWQLASMDQVQQLQNFFDTMGRTGTASVNIPRYGYSPYTFRTYSGTVLQEPTFEQFFAEHEANVTLLITKIRIT